MKITVTRSKRIKTRNAHKITVAMAIPISIAGVATKSGRTIPMERQSDELAAKAKLETPVNRDSTMVQPVMKDRGRDHLGGARAAIHQYVAPLMGMAEHSSPNART